MIIPLGETRDTQLLVQIHKTETGITRAPASGPLRAAPAWRVKPTERS